MIKFKTKLSRQQQETLRFLMEAYPIDIIENEQVRYMVQHIGGGVYRRLLSHLVSTTDSRPWTLSLKPGEAAMLRLMLNLAHYRGYEQNLQTTLLHELHRYFENLPKTKNIYAQLP